MYVTKFPGGTIFVDIALVSATLADHYCRETPWSHPHIETRNELLQKKKSLVKSFQNEIELGEKVFGRFVQQRVVFFFKVLKPSTSTLQIGETKR